MNLMDEKNNFYLEMEFMNAVHFVIDRDEELARKMINHYNQYSTINEVLGE